MSEVEGAGTTREQACDEALGGAPLHGNILSLIAEKYREAGASWAMQSEKAVDAHYETVFEPERWRTESRVRSSSRARRSFFRRRNAAEQEGITDEPPARG